MNILNLHKDVYINILNFLGLFDDYKNLLQTNKILYKLLNNYPDGIYYLDIVHYNYLLDYENTFYYYQNIFFTQIIIITDIKQLFYFNLQNIKFLDLHHYETSICYEEKYDLFNENILEKMINLKYLNISESNIFYLPKQLNKLEFLDLSDTYIKNIPKEYINLKYLINISFYNNHLKYIPQNISLNLKYLEIINICQKSIYLSENILYLESYEDNKKMHNLCTIYLNNKKLELNEDLMIQYIKKYKQKKYKTFFELNKNYKYIPKLYFYCFENI